MCVTLKGSIWMKNLYFKFEWKIWVWEDDFGGCFVGGLKRFWDFLEVVLRTYNGLSGFRLDFEVKSR